MSSEKSSGSFKGQNSVFPSRLPFRKSVDRESQFAGAVESGRLERVLQAVLSSSDSFDVTLAFLRNEQDKPAAQLRVSGAVELTCQRCLEAVEVGIALETELMFVAHDDEARSVIKSAEPWVVSDDEVDLVALLEDEILLALPPVPLHPEAGDGTAGCQMPETGGESLFEDESQPVPESESETRENPFKALEGLKLDR